MVGDSHPIVGIAPRHLLETSITAWTVSAPQTGILLHQRPVTGHETVDTIACAGRWAVRFAVVGAVDFRQRDIDSIHSAGTESTDGKVDVARCALTAFNGWTDVEASGALDTFHVILV